MPAQHLKLWLPLLATRLGKASQQAKSSSHSLSLRVVTELLADGLSSRGKTDCVLKVFTWLGFTALLKESLEVVSQKHLSGWKIPALLLTMAQAPNMQGGR